MIMEMTETDFALLMQGKAPRDLRIDADIELAPPPVLEMLAGLAGKIAAQFQPAAWMIVEGDEIVGLLSVTQLPGPGEIHIGYGVAPTRQGRGIATRAVADLLAWARQDSRVTRVSAETGVANTASQLTLERNGFAKTGNRIDDEDGPVICWNIITA